MKNKQYIIFDLDGTLIDSYATVVNVCKHVFAKQAPNAMPEDEFFRPYRFLDMEQMFQKLAEMANISKEEFRKEYDEQYSLDYISGSIVINKQLEILKDAKTEGIGIIVLTNKKQELAEKVCKKMFGDKMVDIVIGRKGTLPIKPHHEIIDRLQEYEITPVQCSKYYGDSISDMNTAKMLSVDFVNVNSKVFSLLY